MSELRPTAGLSDLPITLVIVLPLNQQCACGQTLVNSRAEVVKSQYVAFRGETIVARCPKCRRVQTIGYPSKKAEA